MFGLSIALSKPTQSDDLVLLVGSLGFNNERGKGYVLLGRDNRWKYERSLSSSLWNDISSGAKFGHSIVLDGDTALSGSPGPNSNKGTV